MKSFKIRFINPNYGYDDELMMPANDLNEALEKLKVRYDGKPIIICGYKEIEWSYIGKIRHVKYMED